MHTPPKNQPLGPKTIVTFRGDRITARVVAVGFRFDVEERDRSYRPRDRRWETVRLTTIRQRANAGARCAAGV